MHHMRKDIEIYVGKRGALWFEDILLMRVLNIAIWHVIGGLMLFGYANDYYFHLRECPLRCVDG